MKTIIKKVFIKSLPVLAGYLVLGIGFGILLKQAGYGIFWSFLMGAAIYAGSMQYVAVSLLTSGASLVTVALTTLMVNARHLFYGISMIEKYQKAGKHKAYLIFSLTDETYSLLCGKDDSEGRFRYRYYFLVSLFNHLYWILGCVLGSLIGTMVQFDSRGIEFSMTALFVTVFVEQWLTTKNHLPTIIGLFCSILCLVIFGPGKFLIPSMITMTVLLFFIKSLMRMEENE